MNQIVNFNDGIMNEGDASRIIKTMQKAKAGKPVTVAFLGGSITQGSLSSTPETCYAYLVYDWWVKKFPQSKVTYINAGIGGTTSQFGDARVKEDVLVYRPDFMTVEFSVNDDNEEHYKETYEGLIRRILKDASLTGLLLIHNVRYDNDYSAEDMHLAVGRHYNLPCVSMKSSVLPHVKSGEIVKREITPDDLHPSDAGHRLLADLVINALEKIYARVEKEEPALNITPVLPAPLTLNAYEDCIRYRNNNAVILENNGFTPDTTPQNHITETFRMGFTAWHKGDSITFEVQGTGVAVQFRKSVPKPTPIARVVVDGDESTAVVLDGNFDEDWGDCLFIQTVTTHMENKVHTVTITITEDHKEDVVPFYLVSVIGSAPAKEMLFFKPVFKQMIWGGSKMRDVFGYEIPGENTGECWAISAHPNGDCEVLEGPFAGKTLSKLYIENSELFGNPSGDRFPLLLKVIDAKDNLSIQVHPNDEYAKVNENGSLGKTECWYILGCGDDAKLVVGHNARTREELISMIDHKQWDELIRYVPVKPGDFVQINPGTVHAITGDIMILETQQNSDITYRVYDYDRLMDGKPRQLHLEQSKQVITVPADAGAVVHTSDTDPVQELVTSAYYTVWKFLVDDNLTIDVTDELSFMMLSVVEGEGSVNHRYVKKGDHFILPNGFGKCELQGKMTLIGSTPRQEQK